LVKKLITLQPHSTWLAKFKTYAPAFTKAIKSYAGVHWDSETKFWYIPLDMLDEIQKEAEKAKVKLLALVDRPWTTDKAVTITEIESVSGYRPYEFQTREVSKLVYLDRCHITWEMGLGKTIAALLLLRQRMSSTVLVVCPAMAMGVWEDEAAEWSQLSAHRVSPTAKKRWKLDCGQINIVSYGLLDRVLEELQPPAMDDIIFDEIHYLANDNTVRTQAARKLLDQCWNKTRLIGLTGTLVSNDAQSMHNPLDILYPGRFGRKTHFAFRYMNSKMHEEGYGYEFFDAREDTAGELTKRLALTGSRLTKLAVSHLLPVFTGPVLARTEGSRLQACVELVSDAVKVGTKHVSIHAYKKKTIDALIGKLSKILPGDIRILKLTGDNTPQQRDKIRKTAKAEKRSILVSTISSTKVAIDLSFCELVVYAELTNNLEELLQSLGRYQRLAKTAAPTHCVFVVKERDKQAARMAKKIKAYGQLQGEDLASKNAGEALDELVAQGLTAEEALELFTLASASYTGSSWEEEENG
jgi:superfamily II DNA or RNA helicase